MNELERLRFKLAEVTIYFHNSKDALFAANQRSAALEAKLAQYRQAEPAAWLVKLDNYEVVTTEKSVVDRGKVVSPLYTTPQPAAVAVVLPMRQEPNFYGDDDWEEGWSACIAEVRRLNPTITFVSVSEVENLLVKKLTELRNILARQRAEIADLTAQLEQAEFGKKYAIEWCKALQECAELLGMFPGDRITDVPKALKAQLAQYQQAEPVASDALQNLIEAAKIWAYCPPQGGYKGGACIEDTCEILAQAVAEFTGIAPDDEWRTFAETQELLKSSRTYTTPQPAAVVLPEEMSELGFGEQESTYGRHMYNYAIAEVRRLNPTITFVSVSEVQS